MDKHSESVNKAILRLSAKGSRTALEFTGVCSIGIEAELTIPSICYLYSGCFLLATSGSEVEIDVINSFPGVKRCFKGSTFFVIF
jgi:hypothetical protein